MSNRHLISEIHSWTTTADRRWFDGCDICGVRRLVADYFEGYLPDNHGWLWMCSGCLLDEISDRLATAEHERDIMGIQLKDAAAAFVASIKRGEHADNEGS